MQKSRTIEPSDYRYVKTGSDSSSAKHSATGMSVAGPHRWPL